MNRRREIGGCDNSMYFWKTEKRGKQESRWHPHMSSTDGNGDADSGWDAKVGAPSEPLRVLGATSTRCQRKRGWCARRYEEHSALACCVLGEREGGEGKGRHLGHLLYHGSPSGKSWHHDWHPKAWDISCQKDDIHRLHQERKHGLFYRTLWISKTWDETNHVNYFINDFYID